MDREGRAISVSIDLTGRVALVTGAAKGMGLEIARTLEEAGAHVARGDVDEASLYATDVGLALRLDVTSPESARAAVDTTRESIGPIDILVNNAGVAASRHGMPFTNQERSDWEAPLEVNVLGTFVVSREVALEMIDRQTGVVVNIASIAGAIGSSTDPSYTAAKAGVIAFTKAMARDLAPHGIRVNSICPGMVMTPFYHAQYEVAAGRDPEVAALGPEEFFDRKAASMIPLGRGQQPRDVANAVAFLASDLASQITGQSLHVDGGLAMH